MKKRIYSFLRSSFLRDLLSPRFFFALLLIVLFFVNAFHESYPDEFDNISGGWFILHGRLPYTGFFTHHGPVPYFLAAIVEIFSGQSFVNFRVVYSSLMLFMLVLPYFYVRKAVEKKVEFYPLLIGFIGLAATYYWTHMLLADNVAAIFFMAVYALIILKSFFGKKISKEDVLFVSILSSLALYSSLTYLYLYIFTIVYVLYLFYIKKRSPFFSKAGLIPLFYIALPHLVFLIYLIVTGSLMDYFYQNFVFNSKYYIYNYPRASESSFINPLRYAVVILNNFIGSMFILALGIKNFSFDFPLNTMMASVNISLFIYLLFRRKFLLSLFVLISLVYSNVRSNPLDSKETDYQSAVYILISFFNAFFVLTELYRSLNMTKKNGKRVVYAVLFFVSGSYFLISSLFLIKKFSDKYYPKYMGTAPLIYDRPQVAPVVNDVLDKSDYVWIGPFEFEELFYANARPASKVQILIPGIGKSERIQRDLIDDLEKNRPKIIMFDKNFFILGTKVESYSRFFQDFLEKNYITLLDYQSGNTKYRSTLPISVENKLDLDAKMYIRRDAVEEIVEKLSDKGYIVKFEVK